MITQNIKEFAAGYDELTDGPRRNSHLTDILSREIPEQLQSTLELDPSIYKLQGSVGQGVWSEIPWVAIMNRGITESTRHGYYVVYLLSADRRKLFVSLGLGWTQFEEQFGTKVGKFKVQEFAAGLAKDLQTESSDIIGPIELGAKTQRGKGYQLSEVVSQSFDIESLNEAELLSTTKRYLGYYARLIEEFGFDIFYDSNDKEVESEGVSELKNAVRKHSSSVNKRAALASLVELSDTLPPGRRERLQTEIVRNRAFSDYVKQRANFVCELCGMMPFEKKNGGLYAEADHIDPLYLTGKDHPDNMRCICAQCHRIMTYGSEAEQKQLIRKPRE